jgi:hypothetical protein
VKSAARGSNARARQRIENLKLLIQKLRIISCSVSLDRRKKATFLLFRSHMFFSVKSFSKLYQNAGGFT